MSRLRVLSMTMALVLLAVGGTSLGASAADAPAFTTQVTIDAASSVAFVLYDVSCWSRGDCTAVGRLADVSSGDVYPVASTEINGVWGSPVEVAMPAGAVADGSLNALIAVQCFPGGDCVAVGRYANSSSGTTTAMAATETGGAWQAGVAVAQPANGSGGVSSWLTGLSCQSADACSAVGTYFTASNAATPMVATETGGAWQAATEIPVPPASVGVQGVWNLSCPSPGGCVATGPIDDGTSTLASSAVETNGTWSVASPVTSTSGVEINSISCSSVSECVAVGDQQGASTDVPLLFSDDGGTWNLTDAAVPAPGGGSDQAALVSLSCPSLGECVAVGELAAGSGVFALVEAGGAWLKPASVPVTSPLNDENDGVTSVSCAATDECSIVGLYEPTSDHFDAVAWASAPAPLRHTITCRRGRRVRRVSGADPRCPSGYHRV
jgi:hypothetical protein